MSNYMQLEFCRRCGVMTNHNFYDNTPKHHEYTIECGKCKLRTLEADWPTGEQLGSKKASPVDPELGEDR